VTPFVVTGIGTRDVLVVGSHYEQARYAVTELRRFRTRCGEGRQSANRAERRGESVTRGGDDGSARQVRGGGGRPHGSGM
jgi:hypothetical protein